MTPGGWRSILYTLRAGGRVGFLRLLRAMWSKNACKTCAVGMGGQSGGMRNELGHFPEFCKKSIQAVAADLDAPVAPNFGENLNLKILRKLTSRQLQSAGRLAQPLMRRAGDDGYQIVGWDEAITRIAERLAATDPQRAFFYFSGRSSLEAAFSLQLLARQYGTNHVNNCSYYCHQASGVALQESIGSGTATVEASDLERADCVVLFGANPASNHPRLMSALVRLRRRGGRVIVVNPIKEPGLVRFSVPSDWRSLLFGSDIASTYIQPHIGGDIAFMTGVTKALLQQSRYDQSFVRDHTLGLEQLTNHIESISWSTIVEQSGVDEASIRLVADQLAAAKQAIFGWTMGMTHHIHGTDNVRWIVNLALLSGHYGRPGAGLLPIRGHSNVQGIGSIGVVPQLNPAQVAKYLQLGVVVPSTPGLDTMGCIDAAAQGQMDLAFCLGGNLFGSNPDEQYASRALQNIGLTVYLSTHLNTGHAHGAGRESIILPVRARDEEDQVTTQESMFNRVRFSEGGPSRMPDVWSETKIVAELGRRLFPQESIWQRLDDHAAIRELIGKVVSNLSAIAESKREFTIPGRIRHKPIFNTEAKRGIFSTAPIPPTRPLSPGSFRLMSIRSEGQFNTVVFEDEDLFRGQDRRDIILMAPDDMRQLGLAPDQLVTVRSQVGELCGIIARPFAIRPGNVAMYCPEANPLIGRQVDPRSKTPSFKNVAVQVYATELVD